MTAVVPAPTGYTVTYSVGESRTGVTLEIKASSLSEAIPVLTQLFNEQGYPINIITCGGSND